MMYLDSENIFKKIKKKQKNNHDEISRTFNEKLAISIIQ